VAALRGIGIGTATGGARPESAAVLVRERQRCRRGPVSASAAGLRGTGAASESALKPEQRRRPGLPRRE
jgi:hypothetical protein